LGSPDGQVAGFVRKTMAETACFASCPGSHVVETTIARIGIGICADTHFVPLVEEMQGRSIDLMLMPHAWPGPFKTGGPVSQADIDFTIANARDLAPLYGRLLGVPAVFANHVGPRGPERWAGIMGGLMNPNQFRFLGLSTIADSDGHVVAEMDGIREGIIAADVCLEPQRKLRGGAASYGRYGGGWLHRGTSGSVLRDVLCYADAALGRLSYLLSARRRRMARQVSHARSQAGQSAPTPLG
jgi:N-carbamoylputrescine amidase